MPTNEEILNKIESVIDSKLADLITQSHNQTAKTHSNIMGEIHEVKKSIDHLEVKQEEHLRKFDEYIKLDSQWKAEIGKRSVNWDNSTKIIYTLVGTISLGVIGALIALIL